ncbi:hypothetical protein MMC24_005235 [Lignoscripta atroalba]|nr:hypothetical protein [Lignoscripta atroalba]
MSSSTSSSAAASSLARYRPAILALTALAAGCGVYYIQRDLWSSGNSASQVLRRSNAVHRPNGRRRTRGQVASPTDQASSSIPVDSGNQPDSAEVPGVYGTWSMTFNGREITVPLHPGHLPNAGELRVDFDLSQDEAVEARQALETAFMDAFFARELSPDQRVEFSGEAGLLFQTEFQNRGFALQSISASLQRFNNGDLDNHPQRAMREEIRRLRADPNGPEPPEGWDRTRWHEYLAQTRMPQVDGVTPPIAVTEAQDGRDTVVDAESEHSWREGGEDDDTKKEGQSLLNLLYHIAEDQARREGYVHRGVTCNSCNTMPIRGVRYRCANCMDFDLCEQCEALQIHPKTHLFYKVRIPAPFLGNPRQPQPVSYPGKPSALPQHLPRDLNLRFCKEASFEIAEVDALYDQFRCLAATEWAEDPFHFGMAIDRRTFDKCFVPNTSLRPPPPNLIYDRMFAFYDTNGDGLIGFEEFLKGLASLNSKNKDERMRRIFQGYDIDHDGFVDRKDFLRMFRAFYALTKELTRDMVAGLEEDVLEGGGARDVIMSSQPISSAFPGAIPSGVRSRTGQGKTRDENGDYVISDRNGVIRESEKDEGDHHEAVGDVAERAIFGRLGASQGDQWGSMIAPHDPVVGLHRRNDAAQNDSSEDADESDGSHSENEEGPRQGDVDLDPSIPLRAWPPVWVLVQDVEAALGSYVALHDIKNYADRTKVLEAAEQRMRKEQDNKRQSVRRQGIYERWRRRGFYIDEENGAVSPEGFDQESTPNGPSDSPTESRKTTLKLILNSPLARSFRSSIQAEIKDRRWSTGSRYHTSTLADFFILLMENGIPGHDIAEEASGKLLLTDPPSLPEASDFVNWLFELVEFTENELKRAATVNGQPQSSEASRRSRSSSKVRFQDDVTDGEHETRSNTSLSSRSIPVGERWGGYEVPEPEKDVGREILYQLTQEGLNELLDPLFKKREDLSISVIRTRVERQRLRPVLAKFATKQKRAQVLKQLAEAQHIKIPSDIDGDCLEVPAPNIGDETLSAIPDENVRAHPDAEPVAPITHEDIANLENVIRQTPITPQDLANLEFLRRTRIIEQELLEMQDIYSQSAPGPSDVSTDQASSLVATGPGGSQPDEGNGPEYPEAAPELHNAVSFSDEADPRIEENILKKPLEELLEESGYAVADEKKNSSDPLAPLSSNPVEVPDPTLPQNRPNATTSSPRMSSAPKAPEFTSSSKAPPVSTPQSRLVALLDDLESDRTPSPPPPSESHLRYLMILDHLEIQDQRRRGLGKLSFEEFEEIMKGPNGLGLGFVGAWIEMASF